MDEYIIQLTKGERLWVGRLVGVMEGSVYETKHGSAKKVIRELLKVLKRKGVFGDDEQ